MSEIRKKIVFLGPAYPYRGGIASFTERLAEEFQRQNWKVKIFTFTFQYPNLLFPGKDQYRTDDSTYKLDIQRTVHSINPLSWRHTAKLIEQFDPDLVIAPHWNPFMSYSMASILKRLTCRRLVLVHNLFPHESGFFDTNLVGRLMKVDAEFLAISDSVHHDILQKYPSVSATQYPHPLYDHYGDAVEKQKAASTLQLDGNRNYLLFFGLVRPYKGLSQLLSAFAKIQTNLPKLDLIIAGEFYESVEIYKRIIKDTGLAERVILRNDFIPEAEVASYFSVSDLIMLPYISATQSGVGRIATHFCKPILVTDVGSLAQMANNGKTGLVVSCNSDGIAEGILKFYNHQMSSEFKQKIELQKHSVTWTGLQEHIVNLID